MTPYQIMQCAHIISPVPHKVKADAVKKVLSAKTVDPMVPDIMKTMQKKMKPAPKRPRLSLLTGLPVSGASSSAAMICDSMCIHLPWCLLQLVMG